MLLRSTRNEDVDVGVGAGVEAAEEAGEDEDEVGMEVAGGLIIVLAPHVKPRHRKLTQWKHEFPQSLHSLLRIMFSDDDVVVPYNILVVVVVLQLSQYILQSRI